MNALFFSMLAGHLVADFWLPTGVWCWAGTRFSDRRTPLGRYVPPGQMRALEELPWSTTQALRETSHGGWLLAVAFRDHLDSFIPTFLAVTVGGGQDGAIPGTLTIKVLTRAPARQATCEPSGSASPPICQGRARVHQSSRPGRPAGSD